MLEAHKSYINSVIGTPYVEGTNGPDTYDCWGISKAIQKELFNRELPSIDNPPINTRHLMKFVREHPIRKMWQENKDGKRVNGQLIELGHGKYPYPIGTYFDYEGGSILHAVNPAGVCLDRIITMKASGWRGFIFHDWIG